MTATDFSSASAPLSFTTAGRFHTKDDTARAEAKALLLKFQDNSVNTGTRRSAWSDAILQVAASASENEMARARELILDLFALDVADV